MRPLLTAFLLLHNTVPATRAGSLEEALEGLANQTKDAGRANREALEVLTMAVMDAGRSIKTALEDVLDFLDQKS